MRFDLFILRWILWALFIALLSGGVPWQFPANGKYLLESIKLKAEHKDFFDETQSLTPLSRQQ
jgi:hypothetical protein